MPLYIHMATNTTPEFNKLDKDIENAFAAIYRHARDRAAYINELLDRGLNEEAAEAEWLKQLDSLREAVDAAYSRLKDHIYPRRGGNRGQGVNLGNFGSTAEGAEE